MADDISDHINPEKFQACLDLHGPNYDELYNQILYREFRADLEHKDKETTFKKVIFLDSLYSANLDNRLARMRKSDNRPAWLGKKINDYESLVDELYSDLYRERFQKLVKVGGLVNEPLRRDVLPRVNEAVLSFFNLLKELQIFADNKAVSFVAKYLHFHAGLVPVYDRRASTALHNLNQGRIAVHSRGKNKGQPKDVKLLYKDFSELFLRALETVYDKNEFTREDIKNLDGYLYYADRGECALLE